VVAVSRQSEGDRKIAELRAALDAEIAEHDAEIARLELLLASGRQAAITKREMRGRLGDAPVKRARRAKADAGGLSV